MNSNGKKAGFMGLTESVILGLLGVMALFVLINIFKGTADSSNPDPLKEQLISGANSVLFISIDSLNMRAAPHLDSSIVSKLLLGERVLYLDKRTPFRQKINLNGEVRNEPWVYIRTQAGFEGWIFGGGAQYYNVD